MTLRALLLSACLLSGGLVPAAWAQDQGTQTRISITEGLPLARQLLLAGQPDAARQIAEALLRSDQNNTQAHILLAQAHLRLGNQGEARQSARTAWRTAIGDRDRFAAALTMADVLAAEESYSRSQFWIRRAIQTAPGPQSEAIAIEAFRRVRQANPLAVELSFGLVPSSNVNSGNSNRTINFAFLPDGFREIQWLVPPDQRPLSGLEISVQTDLRYRIAQSQTSRTSLEFGVFGRTYVMSDSARETAPDVTGESLSFAQTSFGVLHQWVPDGSSDPYSASLTISHDWAGGAPFRTEVNGTLGRQFSYENNDVVSISGGVRYTHGLSNDIDTTTYSLNGRWARELDNDDVFGLNAALVKATSTSSDSAYDSVTLGLSYDFGDILPGLDLAAQYSEQFRVYETSAFDPAGRDDRVSSLRLDIGLQDVQFYGFEPVMNIQARRTDSSVARFDTDGVQVGLNLRSSF